MKLPFSRELAFPDDVVTQTLAFLARKGAGKTYAAGKLVELLLELGVQCVVIDTVGNWYGLRIAGDGQGKGFDVVVLGGLRGDIPLEPDNASGAAGRPLIPWTMTGALPLQNFDSSSPDALRNWVSRSSG